MNPNNPPLHTLFLLGNKKQFNQLLLNGSVVSAGGGAGGIDRYGGGSSGPRSWGQNLSSLAPSMEKIDPNARDSFGNTVLHIVASSLAPTSLTFLQLLLATPSVNVNLQDQESGWTALHRALYIGNLEVALMLLRERENQLDLRIKDNEGLTAFDLYNSCVEGTNPLPDAVPDTLLTWGTNRNSALGHGDAGDRLFPDSVTFNFDMPPESKESQRTKFEKTFIREVKMGKLHTGVVTSNPHSRVFTCGFGSGGRLGRATHTSYSLFPLQAQNFTGPIQSIALGQDHTLVLTTSGAVFSFGMNRNGVLGYQADKNERGEEVQTTPKRVVGPLKKELVKGVAASKVASACWTDESVFTWGMNVGQLGYDVTGNGLQTTPRKVAALQQPVIGLAMSDYALVCLLPTYEVLAFYNNSHFKITFPSTQPFFSESAIYRPPEFHKRLDIVKVTNGGDTFGFLTSLGDCYTLALGNPDDEAVDAHGSRTGMAVLKPQRVWALRKRFTAVRDVALGSDGSVILCTNSGHVFIRTKNIKLPPIDGHTKGPTWQSSSSKSSKTFKFQRIPYLQRIVQVSANDSGAFAALRVDALPRKIDLFGNTVAEDLFNLQPHIRWLLADERGFMSMDDGDDRRSVKSDDDGDVEDPKAIDHDIKVATQFSDIISLWKEIAGSGNGSQSASKAGLLGVAGSNILINAGGPEDVPAHSFILAARSPVFKELLSSCPSAAPVSTGGVSLTITTGGVKRIILPTSQHMTILLLLQFCYSDNIAAVWDSRVISQVPSLSLSIKLELRGLAELLQLPTLASVLSLAAKATPLPTLSRDIAAAFDATQSFLKSPTIISPFAPDVIIQLADRDVACHSCVLLARSQFFAAMFIDDDWTAERWVNGIITINMKHMKWRIMRLVFRFLYEGADTNLLDYFHQESVDLFIDFAFDVLSTATELLLDRLVLICSAIIIKHVTIYNVVSLVSEAVHYNANQLAESLMGYIIQNMETMLESHLLDDMPEDSITKLSTFIRGRQTMKLPTSRQNILVKAAMERQKEWLSVQDFPRLMNRLKLPRSPKLSPIDPPIRATSDTPRRPSMSQLAMSSTTLSPLIKPQVSVNSKDDDAIFAMDEEDELAAELDSLTFSLPKSVSRGPSPIPPARSTESPVLDPGSPPAPAWKSTNTSPAVDMRSIMQEAASGSRLSGSKQAVNAIPSSDSPFTPVKLSQKERRKAQVPLTASSPTTIPTNSSTSPASTPWKLPSNLTSNPPPLSSSPSGNTSRPLLSTSASRPTSLKSPMTKNLAFPGLGVTPARAASPQLVNPLPPNYASGRVITPTRSTGSSSTTRKGSSDAAWVTPTFTAPPPLPSSPASASTSFAHIQMQQKAVNDAMHRPVKSMKEIQAEEEAKIEADKEEAQFLLWWKEEEERMKNSGGVSSRGGGSGSKGKGKRKPFPSGGPSAIGPSASTSEAASGAKTGGTRGGKGISRGGMSQGIKRTSLPEDAAPTNTNIKAPISGGSSAGRGGGTGSLGRSQNQLVRGGASRGRGRPANAPPMASV